MLLFKTVRESSILHWQIHFVSASDRWSTGITVADIDFSLIDSVRTKMPVSKVRKVCYCISGIDICFHPFAEIQDVFFFCNIFICVSFGLDSVFLLDFINFNRSIWSFPFSSLFVHVYHNSFFVIKTRVIRYSSFHIASNLFLFQHRKPAEFWNQHPWVSGYVIL